MVGFFQQQTKGCNENRKTKREGGQTCSLDVELLDFVVFGDDNLSVAGHAHRGLFATELQSQSKEKDETRGISLNVRFDQTEGMKGSENVCFVCANLDESETIVVPDANLVAALETRQSPNAIHAIVERLFETIGARVPDAHGRVFASRDDDWQRGMICDDRNVVGVSIERLNASLVLIIPDLDESAAHKTQTRGQRSRGPGATVVIKEEREGKKEGKENLSSAPETM